MRFYDVPVNQSVPTEANRGLNSYNSVCVEDLQRAQYYSLCISPLDPRLQQEKYNSLSSTGDRSVHNVKHCVVLAPYCTASIKIILDFRVLGLQV
jgi:hypothetical protein